MRQIVCGTCQKSFLTFPSRIGRKKFCSKDCFYKRNQNHEEIVRRFWEKVSRLPDTSACWFWRHPARNFYPHFRIGKQTRSANRISYEWHYGTIPKGLFVLHR